MTETSKNINKQVKLPMLRQLSQHKIQSISKMETLKRDSSSQNIINQSLKNIFKLKNGNQNQQQTKTLLKSVGTLNKFNIGNKIQSNEAASSLQTSKLLKRANYLAHKENTTIDMKPNEFKSTKHPESKLEEIQSSNLIQTTGNQQELRRSISQFYQSYLSTGVTLKTIDVQQD